MKLQPITQVYNSNNKQRKHFLESAPKAAALCTQTRQSWAACVGDVSSDRNPTVLSYQDIWRVQQVQTACDFPCLVEATLCSVEWQGRCLALSDAYSMSYWEDQVARPRRSKARTFMYRRPLRGSEVLKAHSSGDSEPLSRSQEAIRTHIQAFRSCRQHHGSIFRGGKTKCSRQQSLAEASPVRHGELRRVTKKFGREAGSMNGSSSMSSQLGQLSCQGLNPLLL